LSDFKLGLDKDWRGIGQPQVAMPSQLPHFFSLINTEQLLVNGAKQLPVIVSTTNRKLRTFEWYRNQWF